MAVHKEEEEERRLECGCTGDENGEESNEEEMHFHEIDYSSLIAFNELKRLKRKNKAEENEEVRIGHAAEDRVRDPKRVRTKGCGAGGVESSNQADDGNLNSCRLCGLCRGEGHNRRSCPKRDELENSSIYMEDLMLNETDLVDIASQCGGSDKC
ncbi:hypothetical protein RIF29_26128 [Crotalaria pallida]|uniref:Uncharacterized protein n=1 Tax=Crotalaria pallida TaxID=3830 RepID=A0AAN9EPL4_CROPI